MKVYILKYIKEWMYSKKEGGIKWCKKGTYLEERREHKKEYYNISYYFENNFHRRTVIRLFIVQ